MKLICPNCRYTAIVDAAASPSTGEDTTCARCGEPMNQLFWNGSQPSTLTTATAATTAAVTTLAPQRTMENQNAYAPSAEPSFDDVLEIPTPLRSAQPITDQMLVLEDVIPAQDFSMDDEIADSQIEFTDTVEDSDSAGEGDQVHPAEASMLAGENGLSAGPPVYGGAQTSSFDYEGGRAWLRIAPMLLLLGSLVFFALYYLGNRVGVRDRPQEAAATPVAQPETQSAAPAPAAVPENSQNASQSAQPVEASAAVNTEPAVTTEPAQSSAVALKDETPKPVEKPATETAKRESRPPAAAPAATATTTAPATTAATAPAPVADQGTGNFTVQVGSYNNAAQADERVSRLRSGGIEARVVRAEIPHRGTWYRVQAGRFTNQTEAARYATELKGKGATADYVITSVQSQ